MVKTAWHSWRPALTGSVSSSAGGGQCGERRTSECPASDVMGILVVELGKRVRWTFGVQAPAARTRRVQGMVVCSRVEVLRMVMLERVPDGERLIDMALAGWCSWTLRDWQLSMRKRQRSNGSLMEEVQYFKHGLITVYSS